MKKVILILIIGFAIFACNDDNTLGNNQENIDYEILQRGYLSGDRITSNPQNDVITNQNEWSQLVNLLASEPYDLSSINIDFNSHHILYIMDEPRSAGGYSLNIDNIYENSNTIDVYVNSSFSDSLEVDMPTQPFCLVKIPKTNKTINFIVN